MKRALAAVIGTFAGLIWIATYRVAPQDAGAVAATPEPTPASTATPTPAAPASPTPTPAPTPTPTAVSGTFTGSRVSTIYGDVQVRVVIRNNRITDVQAITLPTDRATSAFISEQAGPLLHDEVIQAQSSNIDIVSGATFTSEAYARSVASALQQAHAGLR